MTAGVLAGCSKSESGTQAPPANQDSGAGSDEEAPDSEAGPEDLDYLRNRCAPQMTISTLKEKNGKIAFTTVLEPNEIQMILLTCLGRN